MSNLPSSFASRDPADAAAGLLRRVGFAALAVGLPLAVLLSRRGGVIALPLGCALIVLAGLFAASDRRPPLAGGSRIARGQGLRSSPLEAFSAGPRLRAWLGPARLAGLGLLLWALASLAWTPDVSDGSGRLARLAGTVLIAAAAIRFLPERMRGTDLNLMPLGAALGAVAALAFALFDVVRSEASSFDPDDTLLARAAVTGAVGVFAALGWLMTRRRFATAVLLYALALLAALAAPSLPALAALGGGGLLLALTLSGRGPGARIAAGLLAAPILAGPILPFLLRPFAKFAGGPEGATLAAIRTWAEIVRVDPLRLVTGRGFGAAQALLGNGSLPATTPRSLAFEIWFDLGVVGALALAGAVALALRAADRRSDAVRAARTGAIGAALTVMLLGAATTQGWWVASLAAAAVALAAVDRGQYRSVAPRLDEVRRVARDD